MNNIEKSILNIKDDIDRQEAVEDFFLKKNKPSLNFLKILLKDKYEVIRAEIADYIITGDKKISSSLILSCLENEVSDLVKPRLYLIAARVGDKNSIKYLKNLDYSAMSEYELAFYYASMFILTKSPKNLLLLSSLLFSEEYRIFSISLDLIVAVTTTYENKLLKEIFLVLMDTYTNYREKTNQIGREFKIL